MAIDKKALERNFTHHPPSGPKIVLHEKIRNDVKVIALYMADNIPESRELSLAITKLEEAVMWANAAVARNPLK